MTLHRKNAPPAVREARSAPVYEIKAAADTPGMFEGYGSVFNVVDLFGEKTVPGAFIDSIVAKKRAGGGTAIKMFWSHNPSEPIGKWVDMAEDKRGLFVKGQLNLDVQRAKEVHSLMLDGAVDGLSIGYLEQEAEFDKGIRVLQKVNLLEVSVVSMPANEKATVDTVKSADAIAAKFIKFCDALRSGQPLPAREFEDLLREAGVPKGMATSIASVGYAKAVRSESDGEMSEAVNELRASLAAFKST